MTIINTLKKDTRTTAKGSTITAREKAARMAILAEYGVSDIRDINAAQELHALQDNAVNLAGEPWISLYKIAPAIAYKKMRFKYNQGYDSFNPDNNRSLHDDLTADALAAMTEYIVNTHCKPLAVFRYDLRNVLRAGYAGMDKRINDAARNDREHLFVDVFDSTGAMQLQDVTATIERNFVGSDAEWLFNEIAAALTPRQMQVFKYRLQGFTDETIGKRLGCSQPNVTKLRHTIETRLQFIREYLHE